MSIKLFDRGEEKEPIYVARDGRTTYIPYVDKAPTSVQRLKKVVKSNFTFLANYEFIVFPVS